MVLECVSCGKGIPKHMAGPRLYYYFRGETTVPVCDMAWQYEFEKECINEYRNKKYGIKQTKAT
jgi:hypothetical protein